MAKKKEPPVPRPATAEAPVALKRRTMILQIPRVDDLWLRIGKDTQFRRFIPLPAFRDADELTLDLDAERIVGGTWLYWGVGAGAASEIGKAEAPEVKVPKRSKVKPDAIPAVLKSLAITFGNGFLHSDCFDEALAINGVARADVSTDMISAADDGVLTWLPPVEKEGEVGTYHEWRVLGNRYRILRIIGGIAAEPRFMGIESIVSATGARTERIIANDRRSFRATLEAVEADHALAFGKVISNGAGAIAKAEAAGIDVLPKQELPEADRLRLEALKEKKARERAAAKEELAEANGEAPRYDDPRFVKESKVAESKAPAVPREPRTLGEGTDCFGFRIGTNREKGAALLSDKPITLEEIMKAANIPRVGKMLWELTNAGVLVKEGKAYTLTAKGRALKGIPDPPTPLLDVIEGTDPGPPVVANGSGSIKEALQKAFDAGPLPPPPPKKKTKPKPTKKGGKKK